MPDGDIIQVLSVHEQISQLPRNEREKAENLHQLVVEIDQLSGKPFASALVITAIIAGLVLLLVNIKPSILVIFIVVTFWAIMSYLLKKFMYDPQIKQCRETAYDLIHNAYDYDTIALKLQELDPKRAKIIQACKRKPN